MQPIQINVQINIGLNSELFTLLQSVVNHPAQAVELPAKMALLSKPSKPQPEPQPEVTNQPTTTEDQATAAIPEPEPQAKADEPEPAPAPAPEPQPQNEKKTYTVVDVRAAMDRTRKRIEGENYKENPDGEGYKKWHRQLTAWFKNTAAILGAEKPSALSESESIEKFIQCCDAVQVKGDELVEDCPF